MKILVPVDGSPASLEAVRHALALQAEGLRTTLLLANVQEPASLYELLLVHDAQAIERISRGAGEHALQEALRLCHARGVEAESIVASGEPAHALIDIAEEQGCAAIVVGAHGKDGSGGGRLGTVAHALVHDAPVPVTVVRAAG